MVNSVVYGKKNKQTDCSFRGRVSRIFLKNNNNNKISTYSKLIQLNHHIRAPRHVWWLYLQSPAPCRILIFWFNWDISGLGMSPFCQPLLVCKWGWEWIKHIDWMPLRQEKTADECCGEEKEIVLVRWNGNRIKFLPEREWISVWLSFSFEHWRRGWRWRAVWSWPAFCWTARCQTLADS